MKAFDCAMCGHCCQGTGGIVLGPADQARLCVHLGLDRDAFLDRHAEERHGKTYLNTGEDEYCVFFIQGSGCSVHIAKPDICRAWPFFRGNLEDESSWRMAQDYCPGITPEIPHAEFVRQGYEVLREDGLLRERSDADPNALRLNPPGLTGLPRSSNEQDPA